MKYFWIFLYGILCSNLLISQEFTITGYVYDYTSKKPIENLEVAISSHLNKVYTNTNGEFILQYKTSEPRILIDFTHNGYQTKRIEVYLEKEKISLGSIYLKTDITQEQNLNLISLTDLELSDENNNINASQGLLQATRDIFLQRAAFDFGQAFFKVRGYDSQEGTVLLNGISMNKLLNGRPDWNNWGGLNDVTRNQTFTNGLDFNSNAFGNVLGTTNIDTRPSGLRPGIRLTSSFSNRTYTGRLMATYTHQNIETGLAYSVSASKRWAKEGYVDGTLYTAYAAFGALEYQYNKKHSLLGTFILAKNTRGRSSAITQEVFNLQGKQYNPYWGLQKGKIRNSRTRKIMGPIAMLNYFYAGESFKFSAGASFQTGFNNRSRLAYYNAPNPDPTYYRYLPSYYINNTVGADFTNASLAKEGFLKNAQLNWSNLYTANTNPSLGGKAAYVLLDDVNQTNTLNFNTIVNLKLNSAIKLDAGIAYKNNSSTFFAEATDLLGASFHEDIDPFSNTLNNTNGPLQISKGDKFNYHYKLQSNSINAFTQLQGQWKAFDFGLGVALNQLKTQRIGYFQNQRYLENSKGNSTPIDLLGLSGKLQLAYKLNGRNWIHLNTASINRAPNLQRLFVNPRENNQIVVKPKVERITATDLSYTFKYPDFDGRITAFYTRFQDLSRVNYFYVDAGVGSDFVQEVVTNMDHLHKGLEIGVSYNASPQVKLSAVANIGRYTYANNPDVTINFDTANADEEPLDVNGFIDLGKANLKDLRLNQGPQKTYSIGIEYRDPRYWWIGATTNYLDENYVGLSSIIRTNSFTLNPETNRPFSTATSEAVANLLKQHKENPFYLLNLVGGKSWLKNGKYISLFISINNLFDTDYISGGYQQSRNGNFEQLQTDNLRDNPSFAPKYWFGFGRSYFINLSFSY
ncbi:TonB-dependent receptor [Croceivirga radicis]|uniref:TonB-dependent receptor n=1 Tax=Croceivirga radicis TaxID=1929488 RepID=UPI000255B22E|nr:TonB-dependent receptor [Croceivirga radicis]